MDTKPVAAETCQMIRKLIIIKPATLPADK